MSIRFKHEISDSKKAEAGEIWIQSLCDGKELGMHHPVKITKIEDGKIYGTGCFLLHHAFNFGDQYVFPEADFYKECGKYEPGEE